MGDYLLGVLISRAGEIIHWPMSPEDKIGPELPKGISYIGLEMWHELVKKAGSEEELINGRGWKDTRSEDEKDQYKIEGDEKLT
jgi:hypothetical protein